MHCDVSRNCLLTNAWSNSYYIIVTLRSFGMSRGHYVERNEIKDRIFYIIVSKTRVVSNAALDGICKNDDVVRMREYSQNKNGRLHAACLYCVTY